VPSSRAGTVVIRIPLADGPAADPQRHLPLLKTEDDTEAVAETSELVVVKRLTVMENHLLWIVVELVNSRMVSAS
jgi:hypothetical protein